MDKTTKQRQLDEFFEKHKDLPLQGTKSWLDARKFCIGGSEMSTIAGKNPYSNIVKLIKSHLGFNTFKGNINTYWGSVLEDYTVQILENKWNCVIRETGSLPGVIDDQKYSPDGVVYIECLGQTVLLEIKNAIRRVANGKVPAAYKPQIYTGLATIPFVDRALFIDSMFRRCSLAEFKFNKNYDYRIHPNKPVDTPILLGAVFIYETTYSGDYDNMILKYDSDFIDGGDCDVDDLETLLLDITTKKLGRSFYRMIDSCEHKNDLIRDFISLTNENGYTPVCILPLKLFRFDIVPVEHDDWKKKYDRSKREYVIQHVDHENYVHSHADTIREVIQHIKNMDGMDEDEVDDMLDKLYPTNDTFTLPQSICDSILNSMMV